VTEAEFQQAAARFTQQLPHYPRVGRRPFGYPKGAWRMQGVLFVLGGLMFVPLLFPRPVDRTLLGACLFGVFLMTCAWTLRVLAFTSAASGAVDLWLAERIAAVEKRLSDEEGPA
jgi:hypothetical protein